MLDRLLRLIRWN